MLLAKNMKLQEKDPDRYYHFAVSRHMQEIDGWFPKTLPAVVGLKWDRYFPDKEFLFHQLTALGYRLNNDQGVIYAALACAMLIPIVIFLYGSTLLPAWVAASCLFFCVFSPNLFFRLSMVRPHVLAILSFLILLMGILERKRWWLFAGALLFSLSYHAFYVPLLCLAIAMGLGALQGGEERKKIWQSMLWGFFGLVVGLVVNPYFPSNILGAIEIARIPFLMEKELSNISFGDELYPLPTNIFLRYMALQGLMLVVAIFLLGKKSWRSSENFSLYFLTCSGLFTLGLAFLSRRGGEYFVPVSGLLLIYLLREVPLWNKKASLLWLAVVAVPAGFFIKEYRNYIREESPERVRLTFAAVESFPKGPGILFNCDWDRSPYVMYARPEFKVVDVLDPSLLYFRNPEAFRARAELRSGMVGDAHGLIRNAFQADYVLCADLNVVEQLRADPGFQQLYPVANFHSQENLAGPYAFLVKKEPATEYVQKFSLRWLPDLTVDQFRSLHPGSAESESVTKELNGMSFLSLQTIFKEKMQANKDKQKDKIFCALVQPSTEELRRLQGAEFLALGGGRNLRLWRNGKIYFESVQGYLKASSSRVVIPLQEPLQATDKIELLVCSSAAAPYWGVAMSFWKKNQLEKLCQWKSQHTGSTLAQVNVPYSGVRAETCIGEIAEALPPPTLRNSRLAP